MSQTTHELLTKTQVIREYGYPEHQLYADLLDGKLPYFTSDGTRLKRGEYRYVSRYYIPRYGVERRIEELATATN